ncbi:hypothetical protein F5Y16DRAFT_374758 [Xylariaceae sp. FL0255]|nr:hypothetical protein F5Y16DRAFT_374758 [Xylariaceae sp. FL0255]
MYTSGMDSSMNHFRHLFQAHDSSRTGLTELSNIESQTKGVIMKNMSYADDEAENALEIDTSMLVRGKEDSALGHLFDTVSLDREAFGAEEFLTKLDNLEAARPQTETNHAVKLAVPGDKEGIWELWDFDTRQPAKRQQFQDWIEEADLLEATVLPLPQRCSQFITG